MVIITGALISKAYCFCCAQRRGRGSSGQSTSVVLPLAGDQRRTRTLCGYTAAHASPPPLSLPYRARIGNASTHPTAHGLFDSAPAANGIINEIAPPHNYTTKSRTITPPGARLFQVDKRNRNFNTAVTRACRSSGIGKRSLLITAAVALTPYPFGTSAAPQYGCAALVSISDPHQNTSIKRSWAPGLQIP